MADSKNKIMQRLVVPGSMTLGAGAGLVMSGNSRRLRAAIPSLQRFEARGLADDLLERVESLLGKSNSAGLEPDSRPSHTRRFDSEELRQRRRAREQRRSQRRQRS